jgi:hypothetical protein
MLSIISKCHKDSNISVLSDFETMGKEDRKVKGVLLGIFNGKCGREKG